MTKRDTSIIWALSSQLTTLSVSPYHRETFQFPANCMWSNLQRLCLYAPSKRTVEYILGKATNLKQICFVPNIKLPPDLEQPMTALEIEQTAKTILADHLSLEYLYVSTRGHLERICNSIH